MRNFIRAAQFGVLVLLAPALALLTGCRTFGPPTADETAAVRKDEQSLVFIRVVRTEAKDPGALQPCDFELSLWQLDDADGRVEASPRRFSPSWRALDKSSRAQGWRYSVIPAGNYFVQFCPRIPGAMGLTTSRYYLSILPGERRVYAGTFGAQEVPTGQTDSGKLTRAKTFDTRPAVRDGLDEAAMMAESTRDLGPLSSGLLVSYDNLADALEAISTNRTITVTALPFGGKGSLHGDSITPAIVASSPLWVPGIFLLEIAGHGGSGGEGAGYVVVAGLALLVAAVPVVVVVGGITAGVHHMQWRPYEANLKKEVGQFDLPRRLVDSVNDRLAQGRSGETNGVNTAPAYLLQLRPYRVILRGDRKQRFCLETGVRLRLLDAANHRAIWQNSFVRSYSEAIADNLLEPFETLASSSSEKHRLKEFKADHGAQWFRDELNQATDQLSEKIVNRLHEGGL